MSFELLALKEYKDCHGKLQAASICERPPLEDYHVQRRLTDHFVTRVHLSLCDYDGLAPPFERDLIH